HTATVTTRNQAPDPKLNLTLKREKSPPWKGEIQPQTAGMVGRSRKLRAGIHKTETMTWKLVEALSMLPQGHTSSIKTTLSKPLQTAPPT
ncbi:hypothetical protein LEMLEM_LOCUS14733, partial [Lemmus lemmus]